MLLNKTAKKSFFQDKRWLKCHHQPTPSFFYRPDALPVAQPTVSKQRMENIFRNHSNQRKSSVLRMSTFNRRTCPWLNQIASTTPSTLLSRSAESKMMTGDFPPSSRDSFLPEPAVSRRNVCPTWRQQHICSAPTITTPFSHFNTSRMV